MPEGARQIVRAESGFAYGVIGADIHVFGDGMPLYVLHDWASPRRPGREWLLELPSRMLNARHAVVEFTGRDSELAELDQWRESPPRLAVRWLHGPGGQGKTRLAAEFAARSVAAGWKVITASEGAGAVHPPPGSQDLRPGGAPGVLLIVDYADRWPLTHLTWLFSNTLLHRPDTPARVLLIARTQDVWPAVRAALANHQAGTSTRLLAPLAAERTAMYEAARESFAAVYGITGPAGIPPPGPLEHEDFTLTVAVHMAALAAVDAHASGRRPPADTAALTLYLLDREHLHWARLHGGGVHRTGPQERAYSTTPQQMNRIVFTAALTGAIPEAAGAAVLGNIGSQGEARQFLTDHRVCYPPADPDADTALEPLYPDRLAEDFLALTLPGHQADYPAQPWAPGTTVTVLTAPANLSGVPSYLSRAVPTLVAAAQRWPHVTAGHLGPLLREHPRTAVEAGNAALMALARLEGIDIDTLEAVEAHFPRGRHADLASGIAAITRRLLRPRLARNPAPWVHAVYRTELAERLYFAGLHEEAVDAALEALPLWRALAHARPGFATTSLASLLNWLSTFLAEAGHHAQALQASEQSVALSRRLAEGDTTGHGRLGLAEALGNLSTRLSEAGHTSKALAASKEAADLENRLVAAGFPVREEETAATQLNHGARLADQGRHLEALVPVEGALAAFRRLAGSNPARHTFGLAMTLNNHGTCLLHLGRHPEALAALEEAVELWRKLARNSPDSSNPSFAMALLNLSISQAAVHRNAEALATAHDAVALYGKLARANPAAHEPHLARALLNLSRRHMREREQADAVVAAGRAVEIYRRHAGTDLLAHGPGLANALARLADCLFRQDRVDEAVLYTEEETALRRRLAAADPGTHAPRYARSLADLGYRLAHTERSEEALSVAERAVRIHRENLPPEPAAARAGELANALYVLSTARYATLDDPLSCLPPLEECRAVYARLAAADPGTFADRLRVVEESYQQVLAQIFGGRERPTE